MTMPRLLSVINDPMKSMNRILLALGIGLLFPAAIAGGAELREGEIDQIVQKALEIIPDLEKGKVLFYNCAVCHTPEGWGSPTGRFPQIAGQHKSVILKQLVDIHQGNRDNPTMIPFATPLFYQGPQALADISEYIEHLPMAPANSIGSGMMLDEGRKLYDDNCGKCHGTNGEGDADKFYPRIQGQHYSYLQRQLEWIKNGRRRNADKKMAEQIHNFSHQELSLVADYVSRLRPEKRLVAERLEWKNPDFRSGFITVPKQ